LPVAAISWLLHSSNRSCIPKGHASNRHSGSTLFEIMSILQDVLVGYSVHLTATLLFAIVAWQIAAFRPRLHSGFPALGIESKGWGRFERAREVWRKSGKAIIDQGLKQFPGAFQVFTDVGPKIILPNRFADEIRNNPNLNFSRAINQVRWAPVLFSCFPALFVAWLTGG
jgi:hypothetical protein